MKIIMIDDEKLALSELHEILLEHYPDAEVSCFTESAPAIEYLKNNTCDVAFVDINMPDKTGLELAVELKDICGSINIIFVTGYSQYAVDAFSLNASGYILKPAQTESVLNALSNLRNPIRTKSAKLYVQCFGNFEVFYNGTPLVFKRSKAKELFAYLVNLNGASCNASELCAVLWEDAVDSHSLKSNLRNIVLELNRILDDCDAKDAFIHKKNFYAIDKTKLDCDYFKFLNYDSDAVNSYKGEYMNQYSWSEITHGFLEKNSKS